MTARSVSLCVCVLLTGASVAEEPPRVDCYFGVVDKWVSEQKRIDLKTLPSQKKKSFVYSQATSRDPTMAGDWTGRKAVVIVTENKATRARTTTALAVDHPEFEAGVMPLVDHLLKTKREALAEQFLGWSMYLTDHIAERREKQPDFPGFLVVGRASEPEKIDLSKLNSQLYGFPDGLFVGGVAEPGHKVGLLLPGFLPTDMTPEGPGPVEIIKNVAFRKATPADLGGVKFHLTLEGDKPLAESYLLNFGPQAAVCTWQGIYFRNSELGKTFTLRGAGDIGGKDLPAGDYAVEVTPHKPHDRMGHARAKVAFRIEPGRTTDVPITLSKLKFTPLVTATSVLPRFEADQIRSALVLTNNGEANNWLVAKPEDLEQADRRRALTWGRIRQTGARCEFEAPSGGKDRAVARLGPGPVNRYLARDLSAAPPVDAVNKFDADEFRPRYALEPGDVYLIRGDQNGWALLQWEGEPFSPPPTAEPVRPAADPAPLKIRWGKAGTAEFVATDIHRRLLRPLAADGTGPNALLDPEADPAAKSEPFSERIKIIRLSADQVVARQQTGTERMTLAKLGAGPLDQYLDRPLLRPAYFREPYVKKLASGEFEVPLEPKTVYLLMQPGSEFMLFEWEAD